MATPAHTSPIFIDVARGGGPARPMLLSEYVALPDRGAWHTRAQPYVRNEDGSRTYLDSSESLVAALLGFRDAFTVPARH